MDRRVVRLNSYSTCIYSSLYVKISVSVYAQIRLVYLCLSLVCLSVFLLYSCHIFHVLIRSNICSNILLWVVKKNNILSYSIHRSKSYTTYLWYLKHLFCLKGTVFTKKLCSCCDLIWDRFSFCEWRLNMIIFCY